AASVTETHGSSIGGPACCSTLGSSTYTSTLPANGIVTMREDNGVADVGNTHYTVTWTGTLDLNTGHFTGQRTIRYVINYPPSDPCSSGGTSVTEIQDFTVDFPITLTPFPGPVITALSPPSGPIGPLVTITGQQFGASPGQVAFNMDINTTPA